MRGQWNNVLVALIIVLALLGIILFFWARQGGSMMDFLNGLFGLVE